MEEVNVRYPTIHSSLIVVQTEHSQLTVQRLKSIQIHVPVLQHKKPKNRKHLHGIYMLVRTQRIVESEQAKKDETCMTGNNRAGTCAHQQYVARIAYKINTTLDIKCH